MKTWLQFLRLFVLAGLASANCLAQDITVRVLDVRNGQALSNGTVRVQFHVPLVSELQTLEGKTGSDGIAKFRLPEPMPPKIAVQVTNENPRLYPCYSLLLQETQTVVHDGFLSRCSKPQQKCYCTFSKQVSQIQTKPGELVLLVRPFTAWEKFLSHVWE